MLADDGFALDCAKSPRKKLSSNCLCVDLKPASKGSDKASEARIEGVEEADKLQCEFEAFLRGFFKEICPQDPFRPLPPMLGDGQRVDLLKLLLVVRENGGYDAISENQSWNTVAKDSGLLGSNLASLVKLVYIKYLDSLERWLKRAVENKGWECGLSNRGLNFTGRLIELQAEIKDFSEKVSHKMKKDDEYRHLELASVEVEWNRGEKCVGEEGSSGLDVVDSNTLCNEGEREMTPLDGDGNGVVIDEKKVCLDSSESAVNALDGGKFCDNDEVKSMLAGSDGGKRCNIDGDGLVILDPESTCGKRKRQSLCEMLDWVTGVAKNPCDPAVSSLPEWSKWKSLGKEEMWKQVLLAREAIFLKRRVDSSSDQWQVYARTPSVL